MDTTTIQRIAIQRRVDLSGTLLSPDQAKVSSEVAGVVLEVPVEIGAEVRPGAVLVRLEPRELALALERAESALRQVEAQLGIDKSQDKQPPPTSRSRRSGRPAPTATMRGPRSRARSSFRVRG